MASKVSNFSDLIQRVTASCLLDPLGSTRRDSGYGNGRYTSEEDDDEERTCNLKSEGEDEEEEKMEKVEKKVEARLLEQNKIETRAERLVVEMETLMNDVFDAVSDMKRAYSNLQVSHCPWDPDKMRAADTAVVAELKRLGVLRERYRRNILVNGGGVGLREVVAPYEAAVDEQSNFPRTQNVTWSLLLGFKQMT